MRDATSKKDGTMWHKGQPRSCSKRQKGPSKQTDADVIPL